MYRDNNLLQLSSVDNKLEVHDILKDYIAVDEVTDFHETDWIWKFKKFIAILYSNRSLLIIDVNISEEYKDCIKVIDTKSVVLPAKLMGEDSTEYEVDYNSVMVGYKYFCVTTIDGHICLLDMKTQLNSCFVHFNRFCVPTKIACNSDIYLEMEDRNGKNSLVIVMKDIMHNPLDLCISKLDSPIEDIEVRLLDSEVRVKCINYS